MKTYQELQDALARVARLSYDLEDKYIENDGEVTEETQNMEAEIADLQDLLSGDGIDLLGRWLKSKEDELKTYKAEKEAALNDAKAEIRAEVEAKVTAARAALKMKSVENTIDFVKSKITEVLKATDQQKVKGVFYSFAQAVSNTTKVDTDILNQKYLAVAEDAIRAAGVPAYVTMKLDAKVSLVPEGEDIPDIFTTTTKDTVRFTKPRGGKE